MEVPDASSPKVADRFNHDLLDIDLSVGKTHVSEFLREFKQWREAPKRHEHSRLDDCRSPAGWRIGMCAIHSTA